MNSSQEDKSALDGAGTLLAQLKRAINDRLRATPESHSRGLPAIRMLLDTYQHSRVAGDILMTMMALRETTRTTYRELPAVATLPEALKSLESLPLDEPYFLEVRDCPSPFSATVGILAEALPFPGGGYSYHVTIVDHTYPDLLVGFAIFDTPGSQGRPTCGIWERGRLKQLNLAQVSHNDRARLVGQALSYINKHRIAELIPFLGNDDVQFADSPSTDAPEDKRYDALVRAVAMGTSACTRAEVKMSLIKPGHIDFALAHPLEPVRRISNLIQKGHKREMVLYWDGDHFVMADDYALYLAYRQLGHDVVPAVIMGSVPPGVAVVKQRGGAELMPAAIGFTIPLDNAAESKESLLDRRLGKRSTSSSFLNLYNLFVRLASTVQRPAVLEREVHEILEKDPIPLSAYAVRTRSEVRLGATYRIDLLIEQEELGQRRILLVELENPAKRIFIKKGRLHSQITHALQQAEDWLRWWVENPSMLPDGIERTWPIDAVVVAGRSLHMTEDERRRLAALNKHRKVQLITYDELLDRIKGLIVRLDRKT